MSSHALKFSIRRSSVFLALVLCLAAPAMAAQQSILDDEYFREEARRGLGFLYEMNYPSATSVFSQIAARYPDHPAGPFLEALVPWWEIQVNPNDESRDKPFLAAMDEVLDRSKKRLRKNPNDLDAMFFKAGAHAFRGRLNTDRKQWLRAARDGQQALKYLKEVRKRDPDNPDLLLGIGLFDYLAAVAPAKYPILKPFTRLFPQGDRKRGIEELTQAFQRGEFVPTEAAFSLLQIHYVFEEDYATSLHYARWLRERYPYNSLFHIYEGRTFARLNMWGEARRILDEVRERHAAGQTGYTGTVAEQAVYLIAIDGINRRRYSDALDALDRLERLPRSGKGESQYKVFGRLYKGMIMDVYGRRDEARDLYKQVLSTRGSETDRARERARGFLKEPYQG